MIDHFVGIELKNGTFLFYVSQVDRWIRCHTFGWM